MRVGAYMVSTSGCVSLGYTTFHAMVARPRQPNADRNAILSGHGATCALHFQDFLDTGRFLGNDAYEACHTHPSPMLRGQVRAN